MRRRGRLEHTSWSSREPCGSLLVAGSLLKAVQHLHVRKSVTKPNPGRPRARLSHCHHALHPPGTDSCRKAEATTGSWCALGTHWHYKLSWHSRPRSVYIGTHLHSQFPPGNKGHFCSTKTSHTLTNHATSPHVTTWRKTPGPGAAIQPNFAGAAPKSDSIGTKGCSAATTQNVRDVTGVRSSARSAVSVDARDSLQPVDHAGRAAMAREGMLQLVVVVEAFWPNAGCTQPVTQTTRGGPITRRGTLPPPTPPSSPMRHPLAHCGSPPRLRPRT